MKAVIKLEYLFNRRTNRRYQPLRHDGARRECWALTVHPDFRCRNENLPAKPLCVEAQQDCSFITVDNGHAPILLTNLPRPNSHNQVFEITVISCSRLPRVFRECLSSLLVRASLGHSTKTVSVYNTYGGCTESVRLCCSLHALFLCVIVSSLSVLVRYLFLKAPNPLDFRLARLAENQQPPSTIQHGVLG